MSNVVARLAEDQKADIKPKVEGWVDTVEQPATWTSLYYWDGVHWVNKADGSKVEGGPRGHPLNIKVMDPTGDHHTFATFANCYLEYIMKEFCAKTRLDMAGLRFCFDGRRLREDDTPAMVELEEGDVIEVFQEQTGGGVEE